MDEDRQIFVTSKLIPQLITYISTTISVIPVSGKLTFTAGSCDTASIDTLYRDEGVYADMVLFVKADLSTPNTIASGKPCIVDPVTGRYNSF